MFSTLFGGLWWGIALAQSVPEAAPAESAPPDAPAEPEVPVPSVGEAPPSPPPIDFFEAPAELGGAVTVILTGAARATSVEITCPGGFRDRGEFAQGVAVVPAVPPEDCTVRFKGGPPAKYAPVRGGQSLSCSFQGTTALCK